MKKIISLLTITLVAGCASIDDDDYTRYEDICVNRMGICASDDSKISNCIDELRRLEDENSRVEYITEYKTEYKCCNAPETRTETRVEYKNSTSTQYNQYNQTTYNQSNYRQSGSYKVGNAAPAMDYVPPRKGCDKIIINGMNAERCLCGTKEPVICFEQFENKKRIRRCVAEGMLY